MNRALADVDGQVLAVSQFTLLGSCHKGRRPAFTGALAPAPAKRLYEHYVQELRGHGLPVETGVFQGDDASRAGQRRPRHAADR